jgi:hypothetical protein
VIPTPKEEMFLYLRFLEAQVAKVSHDPSQHQRT